MELVCCQCGKVKRDGRWVRARRQEGTRASHGFCEECAARFLEQLDQLEAALDARVELAVPLCG